MGNIEPFRPQPQPQPQPQPMTLMGEERTTRSLLMAAGERGFGERGDSLMSIAVAAGQANKYAVQYHFDNRGKFINAIFMARMNQVEVRRGELLAALRAASKDTDLIALVHAMLLPLAEQVDENGRHSFARFFLQYFTQFTPWNGVEHPLLHASEDSPTIALISAVDIQRIEVLRGPQGTRYGRNTTGGAVNFDTNSPVDYWEGMAQFRFGNFARGEAVGVINIPLVSETALRVVGSLSVRRGYGKEAIGRDLNDDDSKFVRARLKTGSGPLTIDLSGS